MRDIKLKNYEKFTLQERANLTLLALGRNDMKEAERLAESSPRYSYSGMLDKEYSCRLLAMPVIKHLFYVQCVCCYNLLTRVKFTTLLLEGMVEGVIESIEPEALSGKQQSLDEKYLWTQALIGRLKGLYEGFMQFCSQAGLDGGELLKTIGIEDACFDIQEYLDEDVEPSQAQIETAKNSFLECWPV